VLLQKMTIELWSTVALDIERNLDTVSVWYFWTKFYERTSYATTYIFSSLWFGL